MVPGALLEASWALLEPFEKRLGRSWSCPGGVLGAPGGVWEVSWALLEASWALLEPSGRRLGRPGQRVADMLNFIVPFKHVFH